MGEGRRTPVATSEKSLWVWEPPLSPLCLWGVRASTWLPVGVYTAASDPGPKDPRCGGWTLGVAGLHGDCHVSGPPSVSATGAS